MDLLSPSHLRAHTVSMMSTSTPRNTDDDDDLASSLSVSNWGSESDEDLTYHTGNKEPQGFGEKFNQVQINFAIYLMLFLYIILSCGTHSAGKQVHR